MVALTLLTILVAALVATQEATAASANPTIPHIFVPPAPQFINVNISVSEYCDGVWCGMAPINSNGLSDHACTDSTVQQLASCLDCLATENYGGVTEKTAQDTLNVVVNNCSANGQPVSAVTLYTGNSRAARAVGFGGVEVFAFATLGAVAFFV